MRETGTIWKRKYLTLSASASSRTLVTYISIFLCMKREHAAGAIISTSVANAIAKKHIHPLRHRFVKSTIIRNTSVIYTNSKNPRACFSASVGNLSA